MELTNETVKSEIKETRHKFELPIYIVSIVLGSAYIVYLFSKIFNGDTLIYEVYRALTNINPELANSENALEIIKLALIILGLVAGIITILALLIILFLALYFIYGNQLSFSIKVSEKNFPEIYEKIKEYTELLGLKKAPEVYVKQMNGNLNAYTAWVPGKVFIQLNAEIVDLAYMENKDFDTVFFVMAHEFGHAYLHHVQLQYTLWSKLIAFVPVLGFILNLMLSRAREYSADRVAQALTSGKNQVETMMLLMAGRHAYKYMDENEYIETIYKNNGILGTFMKWFINLMATHPIMPYRTKAIIDPEKKSGKLL